MNQKENAKMINFSVYLLTEKKIFGGQTEKKNQQMKSMYKNMISDLKISQKP